MGEEGSSDGGSNNGALHLHYEIRTPYAGSNYNITGTYTSGGYIKKKDELEKLTADPRLYIAQYAQGNIDPNGIYAGGDTTNSGVNTSGSSSGLFGNLASNLFGEGTRASAFFNGLTQLGNGLWNAFKLKFGMDPSLFGFSNSKQESTDTSDVTSTTDTQVPAANIVVGNNNEETIWKTLRNAGYSKAGTAGLMGNLYAESGLIPNNVQGSYKKNNPGQYRADYTAKVDNGSISDYDFLHNGPGGGGYGLAQWTYYTRKADLLSHARNQKTSIGDLKSQLSFLIYELGKYGLTNKLKNSNSVRKASDIILTQYEQPANQGISVQEKRASYGQKYYDTYANKESTSFTQNLNDHVQDTTRASWNNVAQGFGPATRNQLLGLGKSQSKLTKIDSPMTFERSRKALDTGSDFQVKPEDFEALGFGPGMDVTVNSASTDGRLDKIFELMAEWFAENRKATSAQTKPATSANVSFVKNETHVQQNNTRTGDRLQPEPHKKSLITQHSQLAYRSNFSRSGR